MATTTTIAVDPWSVFIIAKLESSRRYVFVSSSCSRSPFLKMRIPK